MDRSGDAMLSNGHAPHSPAAPLALSDLMARIPCSDHACDGPALSPGIEKAESVGEPARAQQPPEEAKRPPSNPGQDAAPVDWLATRSQLLPRRNQGNRADWVRGWSEAVGVHGEETYCACSETVAGNKVWKGRTSGLASNVRAILAGPANKPTASSEPDLCRNCSRPPSSLPSTATSPASEHSGLQRGQSFSRKLNSFFMRVKSRHSRSGHGGSAEFHNILWPENYQPKWATGQRRFLVRPPSQQKSHSMDIFPGHNRNHINATSSGSSSDSDALRAASGLSRSMTRLKRAAALLQRSNTPK
ncbi:hypothetical protein MFIFM68171_00596 [Madurella fahalii]|uniref:Uncharacterized protein n=1 Tax=Madurella fahalii TaxID=1157608 RepID=A0ABQ0FXZ2_9PEZI